MNSESAGASSAGGSEPGGGSAKLDETGILEEAGSDGQLKAQTPVQNSADRSPALGGPEGETPPYDEPRTHRLRGSPSPFKKPTNPNCLAGFAAYSPGPGSRSHPLDGITTLA